MARHIIAAHGTLRVVGFVLATLLATVVLVTAGLGDDDDALHVGWFEVSQPSTPPGVQRSAHPGSPQAGR